MRDLAPQIYRQRVLIEGIYHRSVSEAEIAEYFQLLLRELNLRSYTDPFIRSSAALGIGKPENQGFEAFIPLIDSGIALYTWEKDKFFSMIIYTCKAYDAAHALRLTQEFFQLDPVEHLPF